MSGLERIGDKFTNKYEICREMHGSMGIVYLLKNLRRESYSDPEFLCAKTFYPEHLSTEGARQLFIEEAENWVLLRRYEHIVWAYGYEAVDNQPYVFTQYCDSGSLRDLIEGGFKPSDSDEDFVHAILFTSGITLGMRYIYNTIDLPHGDISIDNILFTENGGLPKISDFGIMAIAKKNIKKGVKQDIIQFGRIIWYLFTGQYEHPKKITEKIKEYDWIDLPIRELIVESINNSSNDGRLYFNTAFGHLDRYFSTTYGKNLLTPEDYHQQVKDEITGVLEKALDTEIKEVTSTRTEPVSSYINRAASLIDLDKIDEAFEESVKALEMLRNQQDASEARVVWQNLKLLLSKIPEINKRSEYFQRALSYWN
jgi:serine/threonine protein kinase